MDDIVELEALTSWGDEVVGTEASGVETPFPIEPELNSKVYIWEGKLWKLRADAILNSTNESMTERQGLAGQILTQAGPQLEDELYQTEGCRTGECRMTRAYLLPAKKIVHTVGPRYNERYKTAAESALHYCYRNTMELIVENKLGTLGLCCVYSEKKGYPRKAAAHIAVRTVRRFLEQFRKNPVTGAPPSALGAGLSHIVFCVENRQDLAIYREVMRLYFPRNRDDEAFQAEHLPKDVGNDKGEPVVEDRQVRIAAMPGRYEDDDEQVHGDRNSGGGGAGVVPSSSYTEQLADGESFAAFSSMSSAPDASRLAGGANAGNTGGWADGWASSVSSKDEDAQYGRYLRKALASDLSSVASNNFIYQSGEDKQGRMVFVVVGSRFPAREIDTDKALLHLIAVMDPHVHKQYAIVYVNTNFSLATNQPLPSWMTHVYSVLDRRYKKNIKQFYHLHPSMASRTTMAGLYATLSPKFIRKVVNCESISELYQYMRRDQVSLPDWVQEAEQVNAESVFNTLFSW